MEQTSLPVPLQCPAKPSGVQPAAELAPCLPGQLAPVQKWRSVSVAAVLLQHEYRT